MRPAGLDGLDEGARRGGGETARATGARERGEGCAAGVRLGRGPEVLEGAQGPAKQVAGRGAVARTGASEARLAP